MNKTAVCKAHANIALIKYWGKRDEINILPTSSSLSLTLDAFYTETYLSFDESIDKDIFYLNQTLQSSDKTEKISRFLDLFRNESGIKDRAIVKSINYVPTSAGLASSSSGFAALAGAVNKASGLNLDLRTLSMFARRGSGSATRSVYGGFVEWQMGLTQNDSYAVPIDDANWDIGMMIVMISEKEKAISSRTGMKRTVETSPFYEEWLNSTKIDLKEIKEAIQKHDFEQLGIITERNGLKMHGTMLGANPPFCYFEPESILVMKLVQDLRKKGFLCYFTMDAGPNVKILCKLSESEAIKDYLTQFFDTNRIIISTPGPGLTDIEMVHKW